MAITLTLTASTPTPSEENLPVNVALTATAVDSDDAGATFSFSWHIIDKPPSSTASLSDRRVQNPTFNGIDIWGTYRLFCIAQNTVSGVTSTQDPLAATADSFTNIEVLSEARDLVKPAKSQRNWHTRYWELVDTVEHLDTDATVQANFIKEGTLEVATAVEIAQAAGPTDSTSGTAFLAVTTEQLEAVLRSNDAAGNLGAGAANTLRDRVKSTALEQINASSITQLADVDTATHAAVANDLLAYDPTATDDQGGTGAWVPKSASELSLGGSAASAVGDARDIQLTDGSGAFVAANWQVSTGDDFIPVTDNAFDIGSSTKRVQKLWAYDAKFYDDVAIDDNLTVSGTATVVENIVLQDFATLGDNGSAGTLLFTAGSNGGLVGNITNSADETIISALTSGQEAKLSLQNSAASKVTLTTQAKQTTAHTIKLPSESGNTGDVLRVSAHGTNETETEFGKPIERVVYSARCDRDNDVASSFSGSALSYSPNDQACMFWIQNNTGATLTWKAAHIHIGAMKNVTLAFSLVQCTNSTQALGNTWTQVGSVFTLTNSSGSGNTVGQAQNAVYPSSITVPAAGYIGIVCTNIPNTAHTDERIAISFELVKDTTYE